MPKTLEIWEWRCSKRGDAHITVTAPHLFFKGKALGTRLICIEFVSVCYTPELPVPYLNVGNEGNLLSLRQRPVFPSNGAEPLTLEGGISRWFQKKLSCSAAWIRGEKISCKGIPSLRADEIKLWLDGTNQSLVIVCTQAREYLSKKKILHWKKKNFHGV